MFLTEGFSAETFDRCTLKELWGSSCAVTAQGIVRLQHHSSEPGNTSCQLPTQSSRTGSKTSQQPSGSGRFLCTNQLQRLPRVEYGSHRNLKPSSLRGLVCLRTPGHAHVPHAVRPQKTMPQRGDRTSPTLLRLQVHHGPPRHVAAFPNDAPPPSVKGKQTNIRVVGKLSQVSADCDV